MNNDSYSLTIPRPRDTAVVFASPHSGRSYQQVFQGSSQLSETAIRSSEDAFVDELFEAAPRSGAPLLCAKAPRAFVDLNRAPDELDPALIEDAPAQHHNPRIASGLGVIPRVVAGGRAIYSGKIPLKDARSRIGKWWRPYHDRLQRLLDESQFYFGQSVLVDCHSMPSEALSNHLAAHGRKPDIVLGDRYGASASPGIVDRIEAALATQGFSVARNAPFAGAFIAQNYGRPTRNQHVVQVEINRALYMNETTIEPNAAFFDCQKRLGAAIREITEIGRKEGRIAAE